MNIDRNNINYRSLPNKTENTHKTVNFMMPKPNSNDTGTQSASAQTTANNGTSKPVINTEEFAKLDALLEDLLAEVEQPILLNKDGIITNNWSQNQPANKSSLSKGNSDLERSVDWLNEQKERLRNRKEMVNNYASKYSSLNMSTGKLVDQHHQMSTPTYLMNDDGNQQYFTRTSRSKLDSSSGKSNLNMYNQQIAQQQYLNQNMTDNSIIVNNSNDTSSGMVTMMNGTPVDLNYLNDDTKYSINTNSNANRLPIDQQINLQTHNHHILNNKPPVSPNSRLLYSPTPQQLQQQSTTNVANSFRTLNSNTATLKNITETDDENNLIDSEFDRFSQRSFRSNASTVQRSKYHTVSNDYVECTRPSAPTPVAGYSMRTGTFQSKRALSAPPTEIGKVVLQRMELKSPLTVRQGSVVPFEKVQQTEITNPNGQIMQQRVVTPVVNSSYQSNVQYIDNPYNNRGILKTNNIYNQNSLQQHQHQQAVMQQPVQPVQTRNVFLNRAYSEAPRVAYTNGYDTDSGIATYRTYNTSNRAPRNVYNQNRIDIFDSDTENQPQYIADRNANGYRSMNTGSSINTTNAFRTIGTSGNRYQLVNDQSGYDTDTGLIKLRHVLDNNRAPSRASNMPINQQYSYENRSMTPSFNYTYARQQLEQAKLPQKYNSQSSMQMPMNDQRYSAATLSQHDLASYPMVGSYPVGAYPVVDNMGGVGYIDANNEFVPQQMNRFQYVDTNGNLISQSGYINHDGQEILLTQDIEMDNRMGGGGLSVNSNNNNSRHNLIIESKQSQPIQSQQQSLIIHKQIPPATSQFNQTNQQQSSAFQTTTGFTSSSSNVNLNEELNKNEQQPIQQQQQQQQQQQTSVQQESRRGSVTSLSENTEVLRNHPKSVKNSQHYWYKPKISRDEAINLLKNKLPGTFLIRDSNNFPGAYGLALKVDKPPPNVQIKPGTDPSNELVRHFLIEPTTKGVRIKGCCNEPIFGSLAALVYQHSITPLALPIKLILPVEDLIVTTDDNNKSSTSSVAKQSASLPANSKILLEKGAACNVYFLNSVNVETKSGLEAITHALTNTKAFVNKDSSQLLLIQFKVTAQGITLTDLNKKKFLRQHFPTNTVIYCALDEKLTWPVKLEKIAKPRIFGVVCKPRVNTGSNECHLFVELDPDQPAVAIVDFINRYLIPSKLSLKS